MALTIATAFNKIEEINIEKSFWNIKAKIIRLWQVSDFNRNNVAFSVEMVLMDCDGGRIHATIKKTLLYKFKNEVLEGKTYAFEKMGVASNGGGYRTTTHPYKLNFQYSSTVQHLPSLQITKSPYHFVPISDIIGGGYDTDYLSG
jgi:replication factor A1